MKANGLKIEIMKLEGNGGNCVWKRVLQDRAWAPQANDC